MYPGGLPKRGHLADAHFVSMGSFADGHPLGILPQPCAGSVVADLERRFFRLDEPTLKAILSPSGSLLQEPEAGNQRGPDQTLWRNRSDVFTILSHLRAHCEREVHGILWLDLFTADRVCLVIFKRWQRLAGPLLLKEVIPDWHALEPSRPSRGQTPRVEPARRRRPWKNPSRGLCAVAAKDEQA